jgi:hypothetical protein
MSTKFKNLSYSENGLILEFKNKQHVEISFADFEKIYIKKYQLCLLIKIGMFSVLLMLSAMLIIYLPIEIVFIASILFILLISKMNTYKRYQLHIYLYDGTFFNKEFNQETKYEHINLVSRIRKEIFEHQIKYNKQHKKPLANTKFEEEFVCLNLSIA